MSNTLKEYHRLRQAGYSPTFSFRYAADCGCDDHCPKSCECDCHDMKKESSDKCSSCGESNCGCTDCNCKACGSRKEASIKTAEWGYPNKNPNHYDPNRIPPEFGEDPAMRGPASRRPNTPDMRGEPTGDPELEGLSFSPSEMEETEEEREAWKQKLEELKKRHMHSSVRTTNEIDGEPYQEPQDNTASVQALAMGKHIINNLWHNMDVLTFHNVEQARNHLYQLAQRDSGTYKLFLMDLLKLTEQAGEQAQGQEKFNFEHLNMELTNTLASMHEGESPFPGGSTEDGPDFGSPHQASYRYAMEDHDSTRHEESLMVAPFGAPDVMPGFGGMMHEHAGPMEIRIEGELGPDTDIKELLEQVTDEIGGLFPSHENKKKESSMNALEQYHNLRTAGYSPEESDHIVRFASNTILTSDIERMQKTAAGMINNSIYDNGPDPGSNMRIPWARTMIGGPGYNAMRIGQGPVNDPGFSGPYNNSISQRMVGPVRDDPGSNGGIPWAGQGLGISTQEWNAAHPGETPAENARSYQREVAQYMHNPYNTYPQQPYNMNPSSFFPQQTNQPYPSMNPNSFYPPPWSLGGGLNFGALGGLANGIGAAGRAVGDGIGAAGRAVGDLAGAVGPAVGKGLLGVGNTAAGVADIGGAILGAPNAVNNLNGAPFSAPGNSNFNPLGLKF